MEKVENNKNDYSLSCEKKLVAIVVPLSFEPKLSEEEEISLLHLRHFLGEYDKFMVAPEGHPVSHDGFEMRYFDRQYFGSVQGHNKLSFSLAFYETFSDYKYMLMYHLDALVFSKKLQEWCDKDFDYIGAPWVRHKDAPYVGNPLYEGKVGNSGFSLRKISSFIKVIDACAKKGEPDVSNLNNGNLRGWMKRGVGRVRSIWESGKPITTSQGELAWYSKNDDTFWANRANYYCPDFKVAPVETALGFAFECVPKYCFEITGYTLPFGCHAWARYDREFWEPFTLKC